MEWLKITTATELTRVPTDDIMYVKSDGNYSDIFLSNGKSRKMTFQLHFFDEIFQKLKNNYFVRVGRQLIVNKNYIFVINPSNQMLILKGDHILRASQEALKELKALIEKEGGKS